MKMSNDHVLVGAVLLVGDARSLKVVRAGNFFNRGHDDSRAERRGFEVGARRLGVVRHHRTVPMFSGTRQ
jgi:hypothetical protein